MRLTTFSRVYAGKHGLSLEELENFFDDEFRLTSIGKADLKELIVRRRELWRLNGSPEQLLEEWFATENHPNRPLLEIVKQKRAEGMLVALASVQEKYRAAYMCKTMFPEAFDEYFFSCELGYSKKDPAFFAAILQKLQLRPEEVVYFDDSQSALDTAAKTGIVTYLYANPEQVAAILA